MLARMREIETYVGWSDEDGRRIAEAAARLRPALPALVDDFYEAIDRAPAVRAVMTGGPEQVARLKGQLARWLEELLSGPYDAEYLTRRYRVGLKHVEVGVDPLHTSAAMARLRAGLIQALFEAYPGESTDTAGITRSLNKRLDLDHALITDAYQSELLDRAQRHERLAALGQIAGGVAHEMRNPLSVVKTSVYYLRNARAATPEKVTEHLERIDRHVHMANGVITALSNFARSPTPEMRPARLDVIVSNALEIDPPPSRVTVEREAADDPAWVACDPDQLAIVIGNLIRNAYEAMPEAGVLRLRILREGATWALDVEDNGQGIPPEDLARILEPLYSTKARGLGLGLAIARSLLEKNRGTLRVRSELGGGSCFTILIDAVEPTS